jgi:hypothetical protein
MPLEVETKVTKPGYQTTEFWVSVISATLTWATSFAGALPTETAAKISAVVGAVYAVARGLAKLG